MSKKIIVLICCIFSAIGCNNRPVEKPKNLIPQNKMVDILYDISLIEAIKTQNIQGGFNSKTANDYIYKKYKIDSLQLVKSNKFYISDVELYKKMFEEVKERLAKETKKLDAAMKKKGQQVQPKTTSPTNPDTPQVQ